MKAQLIQCGVRSCVTFALLYGVWCGSRAALVIVLALITVSLEMSAVLLRLCRKDSEAMGRAILDGLSRPLKERDNKR